jgi:VIT1/CCC1 family predicted Fe2+/Mn2+ transporter
LILGVSNLLADGFSMGASNYLSSRSREEVERLESGAAGERSPLRHSWATFAAFVVAGAVPLFAFIAPIAVSSRFALASALTLLMLFLVGAARALVVPLKWWKGGSEMLVVGALAAGVAYGVGRLVATLIGATGAVSP